jgi:hypothetical protein
MGVDLYDTSYDYYAGGVQQDVRWETYGEDIGQTGWVSTREFCRFLQLLALDGESKVLEVGSGADGCALFSSHSRPVAVSRA